MFKRASWEADHAYVHLLFFIVARLCSLYLHVATENVNIDSEVEVEAALCFTGFPNGVCSADDAATAFRALVAPFNSIHIFAVVPGSQCELIRAILDPRQWTDAWGDSENVSVRGVHVKCVKEDDSKARVAPLVSPLSELLRKYGGEEASRWTGSIFDDEKIMEAYLMMAADWYDCTVLMFQAVALGMHYRWMAKVRMDSLFYGFLSREVLLQVQPWDVWTPFLPVPHHFLGYDDSFFFGTADAIRRFLSFYTWLEELALGGQASQRSLLESTPFCAVWPYGQQPSNCRIINIQQLLELYNVLIVPEVTVRSYRGICMEKVARRPPEAGASTSTCLQPRWPACSHYHPIVEDSFGHDLTTSGLMQASRNAQTGDAIYLRGDVDYDSLLVGRLAVLLQMDLPKQVKVLVVGCKRCDIVSHLDRWPRISALGTDSSPLAIISQRGRAFHQRWPHALEFPETNHFFRCGFAIDAAVRTQMPSEMFQLLPDLCLHTSGCIGYNPNDFKLLFQGVLNTTIVGSDCLLIQSLAGTAGPKDKQVVTSNWASGLADWIVALDIGKDLEEKEVDVAAYLEGLARRARRGLVLAWGRPWGPHVTMSSNKQPRWSQFQSATDLEMLFGAFNFRKDEGKTTSLRFFAGLTCCKHLRTDLIVLTKVGTPRVIPCSLHLVQQMSQKDCIFERSFGCVDANFIWVADGCAGVFERAGEEVFCVNLVDRKSYTECKLRAQDDSDAFGVDEEHGPHNDENRLREQPPSGLMTPTMQLDRQCSSPDVDAMLPHPLLTEALASMLATNPYDVMDLLVPRSGVIWEGDCHLNMLYYRLVVHAVAPHDWFREPFGVAALRRDASLILDASDNMSLFDVNPSQWSRLAIMLKILAERSEDEPLPGLPSLHLMEWAMRAARRAGATKEGSRRLLNDPISRHTIMTAGFHMHREDGMSLASFVFANSTLGHYLRRLIFRLQ